jgi:hypothetical protein
MHVKQINRNIDATSCSPKAKSLPAPRLSDSMLGTMSQLSLPFSESVSRNKFSDLFDYSSDHIYTNILHSPKINKQTK